MLLYRLIEQPPLFYRIFFTEGIWRIKVQNRKVAYVTFDDGPVPEVTPWVLDTLDRYGVKATFFMVGDNVRKHPQVFEEVKRRGHSFGNHTMHHIWGLKTTRRRFLRDVSEADRLIKSPIFRAPHGLLKWSQSKAIKNKFNLIMYDVVTRDYSKKATPERVMENVRRLTRNGSIIVFHDSLKAESNLRAVLPQALEWLLSEGYELRTIPMD